VSARDIAPGTPPWLSCGSTARRPRDALPPPLLALWHAARGSWDTAHGLVAEASDPAAMWAHAHLHRVEGDLANAGDWYRRAGRPVATDDLTTERRAIMAALLGAG
jgi:hypothetical protein